MEAWFVILTTCITIYLIKTTISVILQLKSERKNRKSCPPGPKGSIISSLKWVRKSPLQIQATLRSLRPKFGPIITIPTTSHPQIFISSNTLAHEALIQKGSIFAERPKPLPVFKYLSNNQLNVATSSYGPIWRVFRRNIMAEILHPSRMKLYTNARQTVLKNLLKHLREANSVAEDGVRVKKHFVFAMFSLLVLMCFGDHLDEPTIKEIEDTHHIILLSLRRFKILDMFPTSITKILFRKRWQELIDMRKHQMEVVKPFIRARMDAIGGDNNNDGDDRNNNNNNRVPSYVDSMLKLEIEEDGRKRKLTEEEIFSNCSEFINGGTDTTGTAVEWIMANLVKNPEIQSKLYQEIRGVVGGDQKCEEITEEMLQKMPYLKAVVLEGLRRHPPTHLLLPHGVTQEVELGGYKIPKNAVVNFTVGDMGRDPNLWEDPMEFKPERFISNGEISQAYSFTGSHEFKMLPFGAGRRMCAGVNLAMLHMEYFVANLIWNFEWLPVPGKEVDLSEAEEFAVVMKYPLHARLSPRTIS